MVHTGSAKLRVDNASFVLQVVHADAASCRTKEVPDVFHNFLQDGVQGKPLCKRTVLREAEVFGDVAAN